MSTATAVDPPAVKKRGRPKKVVAADAGTTPVVAEAKKPATAMKVPTKTAPKLKDAEMKKKTVAKSPKAAAVKKQDAPKPSSTPQQATPITPTTSKILDKIRATGTLKAVSVTPAATPIMERATPSVNKTVASKSQPQASPSSLPKPLPSQPTPATPTSSAPIPAQKPQAAAPANPPATRPAPAPQSQTPPPTPSAATTPHPPPPPPPPPPPQRTTTIPLPSQPMRAPSPHTLHKPHLAFARPAPAGRRPPHSKPYPSSPRPHNSRVIEPMIDGKLPAKYKPAARRVTAIMVGIPIIIVTGWEIYSRWRRGSWEPKKFKPGDKPVDKLFRLSGT